MTEPAKRPPVRSGTAYLVIVPDRYYPRTLRIARVTQNPPGNVPAGAVVTKIKLVMDGIAFEPYVPSVEVVVSSDDIWRPAPVEVATEKPVIEIDPEEDSDE